MTLEWFLFSLGIYVNNSRLETHFYSNWHRLIVTIRFVECKVVVDIDDRNQLDQFTQSFTLSLHPL